ncbi:methyltransferase-like protein (macronuclear) [Tetrahymena thermophila SB210]|uniref:Methyltransferase-like protein n=1 Tax=Tetrahymena thermophila (strain SB210) TaxID=312017 RepID=I7M361_TETTS|nr:methyltransferase-like protein [Tetrahymena thermophila SB210]EAS02406.3 methyltransferase-like protein [Tetrahymena thermophila SB210]|eukprot:XP_001022651.3 methyltransferase-like protein [Tetrahymena thermophila SB210]
MQGKGGKQVKLKHIESFLSDLDNFEQGEFSKLKLEQHMTPANVAALCVSMVAEIEENLEDQIVGDFGCGTGMLSCGMLCVGAGQVIGLELDSKYAQITLDTLEDKFEDPSMYDIININVKHWQPPTLNGKLFDTVVMNPPFGTKDEGIDVVFLEKAFQTCSGNVYSMHKSSTRKFLQKKAEQCGYEFTVLQEIKFPLPKRFNKYHKKEVAYTEVDFILFKPKKMIPQIKQQQNEEKKVNIQE